MATKAEIERKRKAQLSRTERELKKLEGSEQGSTAKPKPKPKPKPKEKSGTGTPSFDLGGAIKKLRSKIAATDDPNLKAKLEARIKAMK